VSWAVADGEDNKAQDQTSSCAGFFSNLCAFGEFTTDSNLRLSRFFLANLECVCLLADADRFQELIKLPPAPPPPPMPPLSELDVAMPTRVLASGGFDTSEMPGSTDVLAECTDSGQTACVPMDKEHPVRCQLTHTHTSNPFNLLVVATILRAI